MTTRLEKTKWMDASTSQTTHDPHGKTSSAITTFWLSRPRADSTQNTITFSRKQEWLAAWLDDSHTCARTNKHIKEDGRCANGVQEEQRGASEQTRISVTRIHSQPSPNSLLDTHEAERHNAVTNTGGAESSKPHLNHGAVRKC